jgi:hypothetical protein
MDRRGEVAAAVRRGIDPNPARDELADDDSEDARAVRICDTVGTSRATLIDEPRPVGRAATRVPPGWTRTVHRGPAPFTASAAPRLSSRPRTRHHPRTTPPPRRAKTRRVSLVGVAMAYWSPWKNRRAATVGSNFSFRRPTTNTRTHRRTRCMRERVAVCDRAVASPPRAFARASGAQHGDLRTRCAWIARASRTHSRGPPHGPDVVAAMWRRRLPPIARQSGLCARTARLLRASPPRFFRNPRSPRPKHLDDG